MNNMNFTMDNIERILSGSKWITRRPFKRALGERIHGWHYAVEKITRNGEDKWVRGGIYHLTVEGIDHSFGQVKIRLMQIRRLQDMEESDLEYEGISELDDFKHLWDMCYADHPEYQWDKNPVVIVIEFELVRS